MWRLRLLQRLLPVPVRRRIQLAAVPKRDLTLIRSRAEVQVLSAVFQRMPRWIYIPHKDEIPVRVRTPLFFSIHDGVWSKGRSRKHDSSTFLSLDYGSVAQLVEQWSEEPRVGGANPSRSIKAP